MNYNDSLSANKQKPAVDFQLRVFFRDLVHLLFRTMQMKWKTLMVAMLATLLLQGCTVLAIADVAASTVVYGVKTVVNVVDAVTPDIINKKKD